MDLYPKKTLRLNVNPEHKNLYSWAINEIDAQGKVGHDQIPWGWTLPFTAASCVVVDSFEINTPFVKDQADHVAPKIVECHLIRLKLKPEQRNSPGHFYRATTFSMFGADRLIEDFQLNIHQLIDPTAEERCMAWGAPSYTSEFDFKTTTYDDCIEFSLFVKPKTFARYLAQISGGLLDKIFFNVKLVSGFYSGWSPSIFASHVKVLTMVDEHKLDLPIDFQFQLPRLGYIGEATLFTNCRLEFEAKETDPDVVEGTDESENETLSIGMPAAAAADFHLTNVLKSLRQATWCIVVLLMLTFIVILLKK